MTGRQRLTGKKDFEAVYQRGLSWPGREIVVRALPNGQGVTRCGFVVGRRLGKAVVRNRVRRRLREIVRKMPLQPGWDIVITARSAAAEMDYHALEAALRMLLVQAGLTLE